MNLETEVVAAIQRAHKYLPREDLHDLARAAIDAYRKFEERELAERGISIQEFTQFLEAHQAPPQGQQQGQPA